MTSVDKYANPYGYERSLMPRSEFREPAMYWLDGIMSGRAVAKPTIIGLGTTSLVVAVRPRLSAIDDVRTIIATAYTDVDGLYTGAVASHAGREGGKGGACFGSWCREFYVYEASGIMSEQRTHDAVRMALPMNIYDEKGSVVRAEISEMLRETATGDQGTADAVTDYEAHQLFLMQAETHSMQEDVVKAVIEARNAVLR